MATLDLQQARDRALPLLLAAGEHLAALGAREATRKDDGTFVTEHDVATDRLLTGQLRDAFPEVAIMSEEQHHEYGGEEWCWVLDPIDGTANFAADLPLWALSLALLHRGAPVMGLLHFPPLRTTYAAIRGAGATRDGRPISVAAASDVPLISHCSRSYHRWYLRKPYKARMLGCTTYNFCLTASGVVQVGIDLDVRVWDVVVGDLLVREAGGYVEYLGGASPFPLRSGVDYSTHSVSCLSAVGEAAATRAREHLVERE
jgi:myo-inositol-1(or 4)-monophosphatase